MSARRLAPALLLAGCAAGEADDVCTAERLPDPVDVAAWTIGVQLFGDEGAVHVEARWPDVGAEPSTWPVALFVHGAWDSAGTPVTGGTPRVDVGEGIVGLHLDLPGDGYTEGVNDRRGAASRAAVAAALRWAAGELRDAGGCTLADRVPAADASDLYLVGTSNGGNLAVATLADPALALPDIGGLVLWETPASPQFVTVELGISPTVYDAGSCAYTPSEGIVCPVPEARLLAGNVSGSDVVCFDESGDGACGDGDVVVRGVREVTSGQSYLSPTLTAAAEARGVLPDGFAGSAAARTWWADRDAARLAEALVAARPALPVMVLASETDHVQSLSDHPHVFGLLEALQSAGAAWTRLNPGTEWLPESTAENEPNRALGLDEPLGSLLPEAAESPPDRLFAAAVSELADRRASGDW